MQEAGLTTIGDLDGTNHIDVVTYQCCHCGGHFDSKPDLKLKFFSALRDGGLTKSQAESIKTQSTKVRGWCMRCNGPVCGPSCVECVPVEQMLENIEKGRDLNYRPIVGTANGL